ncbi:MAG: hypothetical protein MJ072_04810, partial [Clostridia bacterium]|nr:hypothetical protein [Clostridia bacterium]
YLYDEDKWASGFAGGKVTKNKKYRQHFITFSSEKKKVVDTETALKTGELAFLSAYDIVLNGKREIVSYDRIGFDDEAKGEKYYAYFTTAKDDDWFNLQSYVDVMSKEAIDEFISITHERYKEKIGDEFGKAVPSIFTDEPQYHEFTRYATPFDGKEQFLPYTYDFTENFKAEHGYDILDRLPEILGEKESGEVSKARYDYIDFVTESFTCAFAKNIGAWCDNNGIKLTGHLMQEDNMTIQTGWIGEAMRAYRYFGIPGMDLLCNNLYLLTAKQVQSIVHQCGKEGMMSELYGVTNWNFDARGHKYQGDWQAALGVTLRVPHLSWVSMKGSAKRDYPASLNYQNAWYKEYSFIEDHFARVNTVLTRGKPVVKVAVVHPIETFWLHYGANSQTESVRSQLEERLNNLVKWLLYGFIDFDFISESDLEKAQTSVGNKFTVGE